ncbi:MAG TPA: glycosyltransferase [Bacteroidales bacterium]|nr:glycosyltransferase [Bacteroidales bacterium]HSA43414.1 glycosyltransferase [Bacteroidales bacterium]
MSNPLISVIIPCYNHGAFLEEAILSVKAQSYQHFEIIVVDDGSSDAATQHIIRDLEKQLGFKLVRQKNKGLPAARNAGIGRADGELILPLDADDTFHPDFMARALEVIMQDENIKAVSSYAGKFGYSEGVIALKGGDIRDFVLDSAVMPASLFRKADWERIGGYDERMVKGYEDWEFWIRMLKDGGRIHVIPEVLFNYRTHFTSLAVTAGQQRYEIMEYMVRKNIDVYQKYPLEAVLCSERLLAETKQKYEKMLHSVYRSRSYRLGYALLHPAAWIKSLFTGRYTHT